MISRTYNQADCRFIKLDTVTTVSSWEKQKVIEETKRNNKTDTHFYTIDQLINDWIVKNE